MDMIASLRPGYIAMVTFFILEAYPDEETGEKCGNDSFDPGIYLICKPLSYYCDPVHWPNHNFKLLLQ
jgi:hypothetical protein